VCSEVKRLVAEGCHLAAFEKACAMSNGLAKEALRVREIDARVRRLHVRAL
jgi:hypothetical protein